MNRSAKRREERRRQKSKEKEEQCCPTTTLEYKAPDKQTWITCRHEVYNAPGTSYPWLFTTLTPVEQGSNPNQVTGHFFTAKKLVLRLNANCKWPAGYIGPGVSAATLPVTTTWVHVFVIKHNRLYVEADDALAENLFKTPLRSGSDFNHNFLQGNKVFPIYSQAFRLGNRIINAGDGDLEWLTTPPQIAGEDIVIDLPNLRLEADKDNVEFEQILLASSTDYFPDDWTFYGSGTPPPAYTFHQITDDGVALHVYASTLFDDN